MVADLPNNPRAIEALGIAHFMKELVKEKQKGIKEQLGIEIAQMRGGFGQAFQPPQSQVGNSFKLSDVLNFSGQTPASVIGTANAASNTVDTLNRGRLINEQIRNAPLNSALDRERLLALQRQNLGIPDPLSRGEQLSTLNDLVAMIDQKVVQKFGSTLQNLEISDSGIILNKGNLTPEAQRYREQLVSEVFPEGRFSELGIERALAESITSVLGLNPVAARSAANRIIADTEAQNNPESPSPTGPQTRTSPAPKPQRDDKSIIDSILNTVKATPVEALDLTQRVSEKTPEEILRAGVNKLPTSDDVLDVARSIRDFLLVRGTKPSLEMALELTKRRLSRMGIPIPDNLEEAIKETIEDAGSR